MSLNTIPNIHSEFIRSIFPEINRVGIDLPPNLEIKEQRNHNEMFTIEPKDLAAEFIVFYSHSEDEFYCVPTNKLPKITKKRGIRLSQVIKLAIKRFKSITALKKYINLINKPKKIFVVDIETTGLDIYSDKIIEIGIVELNLEKYTITPIFDELVIEDGYDPDKFKNSWIFQNSTLNPYIIIEKGIYIEEIKDEIQDILERQLISAYNIEFDASFLKRAGFRIPRIGPDPMLILTDIMRIPHSVYGFKWPKMEEGYNFLLPEESYSEKHRALDDAVHEAKIIWKLYQMGLYKI